MPAPFPQALASPSSGSGDNPLCNWPTTHSNPLTPDLCLSPFLSARVISFPSATGAANSPSLSGFRAVLLALFAAEDRTRAGRPVLLPQAILSSRCWIQLDNSTRNSAKTVSGYPKPGSFLENLYSPSTVLTLLQEVSAAADVKIDWNALVEKTATGITNAREYQMLWRHLAYRHPLLDKIEEGAEPLIDSTCFMLQDDDSDLEIELEIAPPITEEASCQAKEYAQLLLGSRKNTDLEAPLAEKGVDKEMLDTAPDKQPLQTSHAVASSSLQKKLSQPTGAPIVGSIEPGLDEVAEGVVGDVQGLVRKKRRLGDGADETPVD
ncbi:hypothetical protein ZIOFF_020513 [Zingiber officinale]|uniref:Uncharacterized protein n=1 Tax=Zingiber officinale TaxID=94328 RepID=A0A8J5H2E8_ZINOF|nr:hypothetical protein ZIOFF_020513 [Zingiber officinale]